MTTARSTSELVARPNMRLSLKVRELVIGPSAVIIDTLYSFET